jgi:hypothetical protein
MKVSNFALLLPSVCYFYAAMTCASGWWPHKRMSTGLLRFCGGRPLAWCHPAHPSLFASTRVSPWNAPTSSDVHRYGGIHAATPWNVLLRSQWTSTASPETGASHAAAMATFGAVLRCAAAPTSSGRPAGMVPGRVPGADSNRTSTESGPQRTSPLFCMGRRCAGLFVCGRW